MAVDLDDLLAPLPDGGTGHDLAYDPERHEIEHAFEASVSIDTSGQSEEGAEIDWRAIIATIAKQAGRTKDLWLAVYLARAGARSGKLDSVQLGLEYLAGLVETQWLDVHPRLEEYGFQGRKGACDTLASHREFVGPMQRLPLLRHARFGEFSADDLARFHRGTDGEEGYGPFRAALADGGEDVLAEHARRFDAMEAAVRRTDAVLVAQAGTESGTNFKALYDLFGATRAAIQAFAPEVVPAAEDTLPSADAVVAGSTITGGSAARVDGRADVTRMLDLVIDYYRRHEPGSPVPLLLSRARSWVNLGFMDVLNDISPGGVAEARALLALRQEF